MIDLRQRWIWLPPAMAVAMGLGAMLAALLPDVLAAYSVSFVDQAFWSFTCF